MIRSGLTKSGQITLPNAPAIPLGRRVAGSPWCRSRLPIWTARARRPLHGNLSGQWPIFGVRPVGERLGDWALIEARSPVPSDLSNGNL